MVKTVTRLFTQFQPAKYGLALAPDPEAMTFTGKVMISGKKVSRPSQRITFHQKGLKINAATIIKHDKKGDQTIEVARINNQASLDEVRLHADAMLYPGEYTVTLEFSGNIHEVMHGIYPCNYEIDGKKQKLIATQFESHHAREAFPCIDEPEAKATFDLTLITPKDQTAISNMPAKEFREEGDHLVTTFETTPKMSTYLLAFVFGDMQFKETTTKDGVAVRVWTTKQHSLESLDFGLDVAKRGIEFFNDYYNFPYPLAKCDHVALPDFSVGAMENWGLITYRESCLISEPSSASQSSLERIATVITHELSHQWFGDLVTMKWWDELWLNESFANVMEYVATDALFPEWDMWNSFVAAEGLYAIRRDAIPGVQAVKTDVNHPDEISTLFDPAIVYAKGGRLLNMLMNYIGQDDFRKGLTAYFAKHQYGNTAGSDLWEALSATSGKDVAAFMNPWLTRSGFPLITVNQQGKDLALSQEHFLLDPAKADPTRIWSVPLLSKNSGVPELLDTANVACTLADDNYVHIDDGAIGHYIVNYAQPAHAAAMADAVRTNALNEPERLMLLHDSSLVARAGKTSFAATLQLLGAYKAEASEPVWDILAITLGETRRFIDGDPSLEQPHKALTRQLIQTQYERLGWIARADESSHDTKLRATIIALGIYADDLAITNEALAQYKAYLISPESIAAELRSVVLSAAIHAETDGAFEYMLQLHEHTSDVHIKDDLLGALTNTKLPAQALILLERLKDRNKVKPQDVDHWVVYLLRNRYTRQVTWKWLRDNWSWIEETFASDKSYDNFPRFAAGAFNTQILLDEYKTFFEPMLNNVALSRNISLGIEELSTRITWLQRDLAAVQDFFKTIE